MSEKKVIKIQIPDEIIIKAEEQLKRQQIVNQETSKKTEEEELIEKLKNTIKYMGAIIEDCEKEVRDNAKQNKITHCLPYYQCSADNEFIRECELYSGKWCPYCSNCHLHCKCGYAESMRNKIIVKKYLGDWNCVLNDDHELYYKE